MTEISSDNYAEFLGQLKNQIRQRQYQALRAVNHELVGLYWKLGQAIHQKQEELGWGKAVVQNLARDLQTEFPRRNGFSAQSLWLMQQFYREYSDFSKLQPWVREISRTKNSAPIGIIICRSKNKTVVEYALRNAVCPLGVATYAVVLQLPDDYKAELPSPELIAERLRLWDKIDDEDQGAIHA